MVNVYNDVFIYSFRKENYIILVFEFFYCMSFRGRKRLFVIIVIENVDVYFFNFFLVGVWVMF